LGSRAAVGRHHRRPQLDCRPHMNTTSRWMSIAHASRFATLAILTLVLGGCGAKPRSATTGLWIMGGRQPAFDPQGPPDPRRWALERLLTRGLIERDSVGRVVAGAARGFEVSADSLRYTFHLPRGLSFVDGSRCVSTDF